MACERWFEALSAIADGEEPPVDRALVDAHVRRCPTCRARQAELAAATAGIGRPAPAPPAGGAPAGTAATVAATARREAERLDRSRHPAILRWLLVVLAIQIIVLAAPALVFGDEGTAVHEVRHTGAFAIAYAVGLLLVARRPARARTLLTVGQVLVAALVLSAVVDVVDGSVSLLAELLHLPEVLSVVVLWVLSDIQLGRDDGGRWYHAIVPPPTASAGR